MTIRSPITSSTTIGLIQYRYSSDCPTPGRFVTSTLSTLFVPRTTGCALIHTSGNNLRLQQFPLIHSRRFGIFLNDPTKQLRKYTMTSQLRARNETNHDLPPPPLTGTSPPAAVVKIAIIGAGPAGLVAARVVSRTIQQQQLPHDRTPPRPQFSITVLEKETDIGGVWKYRNASTLEANHMDLGTSVSSSRKKNHPMYRHLRTNLPKEIMAYREYPWTTVTASSTAHPPRSEPNTNETTASRNNNMSYVPHDHVYEYLNNYCQQYQLHTYIRYRCTVRQLTCWTTATTTTTTTTTAGETPSTPSYFSPKPPATNSMAPTNDNDEQYERKNVNADDDDTWPMIQLTWDDDTSTTSERQSSSDVFDAVFICNGHYNVPSYPNIPGLEEYFRGTLLHSMEYDIPDPFRNQTVLCIGGRASGADIAREIAQYGRGDENGSSSPQATTTTNVYLSDSSFPKTASSDGITDQNVTWVPRTIRVLPDGRVQFDSHSIEPINVDTIILCTGYDYDFPFINGASNMKDFIGCDRRRVQLLYEQLWYVSAPNIAFVGIPHSIIPFPLFEFQCEAVVQSWFRSATPPSTPTTTAATTDNHNHNNNNHRTNATLLTLPNQKVRRERAMMDAISGGYGKENGRIPEDTHYLGQNQWDYCRTMARYANVYSNTVESYIATNKVRAWCAIVVSYCWPC